MAKNGNNKSLMVVGLIVILIIGVYVVAPETFTGLQSVTSSGSGGVQTPSQSSSVASTQDYEGSVTVNLVHRDALDNSESRTEATNLTTTYYKKVGGDYKAIGSGTGNTIYVDPTISTVYMGVAVPSGQSYFVAPASTAENNDRRISGYMFSDVTGDGQREWVFEVDVTGLQIQGGQTTPTIDLYIDSYDDGTASISSPADQTAIGQTAGTNNFIQWEVSLDAVEKADPQYKYEIKINQTDTAMWDAGQSYVDIPNVGKVYLSDMDESQDGTNTYYKYTLGTTLEDANYVTVGSNDNNAVDITGRISTNFDADNEGLLVDLKIYSFTSSQGTATASDQVKLAEQ